MLSLSLSCFLSPSMIFRCYCYCRCRHQLRCPFVYMKTFAQARAHLHVYMWCAVAYYRSLCLPLYLSPHSMYVTFFLFFFRCLLSWLPILFGIRHLPSIINTFMIHIKYYSSWTTLNTRVALLLLTLPCPLLFTPHCSSIVLSTQFSTIHLLFYIGLYPVWVSEW